MSQTEIAEANAAPAERTTDRIARWLTLGANIGVVLGLVMLIVASAGSQRKRPVGKAPT